MSSRIAAKSFDVLPIDGTLGAPQLLFLRKTEQTTDPSLMRKMLPLNTCQQVRSALYKMNESASEKVKLQKNQLRDGRTLERSPGMTLLISFVSTRSRQQKRSWKKKKSGLTNFHPLAVINQLFLMQGLLCNTCGCLRQNLSPTF